MLRIYTASRFHRADLWIELSQMKRFNHYFHARWLKHYTRNHPETPANSRKFWPENLEDIRTSDCVIVYSENEDIQGGAFIEAGAALAFNKKVYVAGENPGYRSWIHHPNVIICKSILDAINEIDLIENPRYCDEG